MAIKTHTGGTKEIVHTGREKYDDTEHTEEFKKAYRTWSATKEARKKWNKVIVLVVIFAILYLVWRFMNP